MKKLNASAKEKVNNVRAEIAVLNLIIDAKYFNLVDNLGEELSENMEAHLFDYVYNPEWSHNITESHLFE